MTATVTTTFAHQLMGFRITAGFGENLGTGIHFADDFNGDGLADLVMSGPKQQTTDTVVLFGKSTFGAGSNISLNNLAAADGFRIDLDGNGNVSSGLGAGDVNGDGLTDLILVNDARGDAFVLFGTSDLTYSVIDLALLDSSDGFEVKDTVNMPTFYQGSANRDFNGNGLDDFVIGARAAGNVNNSGQVYIIFGSTSSFGATMDLDDLSFNQGFQVLNDGGGFFGQIVTGGADINGDSFDDIAIGGGENANGNEEQTVLLGQDFSGNAAVGGDGADTFTGDSHTGDRFFGGLGDDILIDAGDADVLSGGARDDILVISDNNFVRVDGRTGDGILRIPGDSGVTLDFTQVGLEGIHSIETINLCGVSGNFLRIRPVDVAVLSDTTNKLFVTGGAADGVTLIGDSLFPSAGDPQSFVFAGVETVGGVTFDRYEAGARIISVQQGIVVSREVSIGDLTGESIRLLDVDGDVDGNPAVFGLGTSGTLGADLNGDGVSDVLLSGPGPVGGNGLIVDIRSEELLVFGDLDVSGQDDLTLAETGQRITSVGDMNGDGFDDFVQVQANYNSGDGYASIEFGNAGTGGTQDFDNFNGEVGTAGRLGAEVSDGGDFNGDGIADMIAGAPFVHGAAGANSGRAYIIYGQTADAGKSISSISLHWTALMAWCWTAQRQAAGLRKAWKAWATLMALTLMIWRSQRRFLSITAHKQVLYSLYSGKWRYWRHV
jgi:hypothetical protein